jgi:S1-C subfamily serine protease
VLITEVKPYGRAYDQKLAQGLVIVEADKKKIDDVEDLKKVFEQKKGSAVLLKLQDVEGVNQFRGIEIPE